MIRKRISLGDIKKENIFQVPEGYFDDLPSIIQAKAVKSKSSTMTVTWSARRTWGSVAACSAIAILGYFTLMPKQGSIGEESLNGVKNQEIVSYLSQQGVPNHDIIEHLDKVDLEGDQAPEMLNNLGISNKDILENVDVSNVDEEI
ncbi:hypothetical protein SAMN04515674_11119 [Pseudarcicella hirudinis]|uniref:Uncharacterized protein n=1 Tax=Pseudarcicella hirudinis TaxID=1079859 RepID=A0A1I5W6W4_9BACT|nr:hypothetical protein [Pseudarcicella hirudinis]SFQ15488.1 hypothetical protein SAMN04515674_11119 [Pseudarcicella hirudinis]